jgi:hypothetical protein
MKDIFLLNIGNKKLPDNHLAVFLGLFLVIQGKRTHPPARH